jgi:hypothetical protein
MFCHHVNSVHKGQDLIICCHEYLILTARRYTDTDGRQGQLAYKTMEFVKPEFVLFFRGLFPYSQHKYKKYFRVNSFTLNCKHIYIHV